MNRIMKKNRVNLIYLLVTSALAFNTAQGQNNLDQIVKGGVQDANTLVSGYAAPALNAIGYGLNQGWYNTAKPHKVLGIDLTATFSFIRIPNADLSYYVDNTKLQNIERLTGPGGNVQSGYVPTVFGANQTPTYAFKSVPGSTQPPIIPGSEFSGPPGVDLSSVPVIKNSMPIPMVQLGLGLPKGFELKFRYVPTINFGSNSKSNFSLFGIGLMHDVKQYIPGIKSLPFDLSGFIGYTKMTLNADFNAPTYPDQKAIMTTSATTIQGVISKKFAVLTGYAGLGYNIASSKLAVNGTYDVGKGVTVKDPINLNVSASGPRATFGLRLKLAVFTFSGEYTLQKYSALSLGFGLSVR